jgi:hypothetical protein
MGCGCKKKSSKESNTDGSDVIKEISEDQRQYQRRVSEAFKKVTNIRTLEKIRNKINPRSNQV